MSEQAPVRELGAPRRPTDEVDVDREEIGEETRSVPLDSIKEELAADVETEDLPLPVPRRPGYELTFSTNLDGEKFDLWARKCKDRKALGGIDELKLALFVLANQNTGIRRQGGPVEVEGQPMTVRTQAFLDMTGTGRPFDALRKLYGSDGHVQAAAREVLAECGYGEDLASAAEDPTARPSSD